MIINLTLNDAPHSLETTASEPLLALLRRNGIFGVKHGCETGECGACAVLVNGKPVVSCVMLAAQTEGATVTTIEALSTRLHLHPLQKAFASNGAIQCGYCTPAMVLAAASLLEENPAPSEAEVREALSGVLCRCTGYVKPVQAILHAAAQMRGDEPEWPPVTSEPPPFQPDRPDEEDAHNLFGRGQPIRPPYHDDSGDVLTQTQTRIRPMTVRPTSDKWDIVGKPEVKVDAVKLARGNPAFTDDIEMRGMLHAKILKSPVAHAWITKIDASKARALPGVHAVLTHEDLPRVVYSTAGQSDPIPGPLDMFSLDHKVRFVGDRVAMVAAETTEIAERALELIEVEYEELPAILDSRDAMREGAVILHDEEEYVPFDSHPEKNVAADIRIDIGDVETGFAEADQIFEEEYDVPKVQQASIEPHVVVTWWDENDRLVIRTSTQVPFHVRRMLAPVLGLAPKQIRVIKPRIGGGFGGKQEVMIEDVAAHLSIVTGRPVRFEYTREEEFIAARSRHPMRVRMKTGVLNDGTIIANEMYALTDTGAYGCHALTVTGNTGHKAMALYVGLWRDYPDGYQFANIRFHADVVYTNTPPAGAFRGYGVPAGLLPVERPHGKNRPRAQPGPDRVSLEERPRGGGRASVFECLEGRARTEARDRPHVRAAQCVEQGGGIIGWNDKAKGKGQKAKGKSDEKSKICLPISARDRRRDGDAGHGHPLSRHGRRVHKDERRWLVQPARRRDRPGHRIRHGACADGSRGARRAHRRYPRLLHGYRLHTIRQGRVCLQDDIHLRLRDGAGGAAVRAADPEGGGAPLQPRRGGGAGLCGAARAMHPRKSNPGEIDLAERAWAPDGRKIPLTEIALHSLHHEKQHQIMGIASYVSPVSPPPFAAQFAQVTVDMETGQVTVDNLVMAVDSGLIVNPVTASGQIEGGMTQALGYAVCEEMRYDEEGNAIERDLDRYHIFGPRRNAELETIFVETFEPTHPFGVKAVAEIPMDGVAPAVGNAILDAVGVWLNEIPATPERVWRAMGEGCEGVMRGEGVRG